MKITVKLVDGKELIFEPDNTMNVSIEISKSGKIEIFSCVPPDFYQVPLAGPFAEEETKDT